MRWTSVIRTVTLWLLIGPLTLPCGATKFVNLQKCDAEEKEIERMTAQRDIDGLVEMLSAGEFFSKVTAARRLGEFGDERAVSELMRLNATYSGWPISWDLVDEYRSGVFAVAVCKILTRGEPAEVQLEALLDLVDGQGPAVPGSLAPPKMNSNGVLRELPLRLDCNRSVGGEVAGELDRFDDPSIVLRLRRSENSGISPYAVWREVRDMDVNTAVARCEQIAMNERNAQRYGAIHCLSRFGPRAFAALDRLARDGMSEAVRVLGERRDDPNAFDLLCWHLRNNERASVRYAAAFPVAHVDNPALRVRSLQALIEAFYDPSESVRRGAANDLSSRAYRNSKPYFDEVESQLLIALKHPDADVRDRVRKSLERLGCQRLDEDVPDPPAIRAAPGGVG